MDAAIGQAFSGLAQALFPNPQSLAQAAELKARRELINQQTRNAGLQGDALQQQNGGYTSLADALGATQAVNPAVPGGPIQSGLSLPDVLKAAVLTRDPNLLTKIPGMATILNPNQWGPSDLANILVSNGIAPYQSTPAGAAAGEKAAYDRQKLVSDTALEQSKVAAQGRVDAAEAKGNAAATLKAVNPRTFAQLSTLLAQRLHTAPGADGSAPQYTIDPAAFDYATNAAAQVYQQTNNAAAALEAGQAALQQSREFSSGVFSDTPGEWTLADELTATPTNTGSATGDRVETPAAAPAAAPAASPATMGALSLIGAYGANGVSAFSNKAQASDQIGAPAAAQDHQAPTYKEGDMVQNAKGEKLVLRNNKWVPVK